MLEFFAGLYVGYIVSAILAKIAETSKNQETKNEKTSIVTVTDQDALKISVTAAHDTLLAHTSDGHFIAQANNFGELLKMCADKFPNTKFAMLE